MPLVVLPVLPDEKLAAVRSLVVNFKRPPRDRPSWKDVNACLLYTSPSPRDS